MFNRACFVANEKMSSTIFLWDREPVALIKRAISGSPAIVSRPYPKEPQSCQVLKGPPQSFSRDRYLALFRGKIKIGHQLYGILMDPEWLFHATENDKRAIAWMRCLAGHSKGTCFPVQFCLLIQCDCIKHRSWKIYSKRVLGEF